MTIDDFKEQSKNRDNPDSLSTLILKTILLFVLVIELLLYSLFFIIPFIGSPDFNIEHVILLAYVLGSGYIIGKQLHNNNLSLGTIIALNIIGIFMLFMIGQGFH